MPLKAPVKQGDIIGKIHVMENEQEIAVKNIYARENIDEASLWQLYGRYLVRMLIGK